MLWSNVKTTLLLATLTGLFTVGGLALGGQTGMMIAFVIAVAMNMGAWWFSDKLALKMSGARPVTEEEMPELHAMVAQLSERAKLPKPAVYIIENDTPNAFATGRSPNHSAVAATTGLMRLLDRDELAGVMAHELAHIKHRDTLISSISATIAGAVMMVAEMAQWAMIFSGLSGNSEEEESGGIGGFIGTLLMIILAPIAAMLIQMAISRSREYKADEGGARILGDAMPLASALEKLEWAAGRKPMSVNPATSHLYIVNPLRGGISGLFSTHPSTDERIARLRALAQRQVVSA